MLNWVKRLFNGIRPPAHIQFEFERINEKEVRLKFSSGEEKTMTNEEFKSFLRSENVKLQGLDFKMDDQEKMARFMQSLADQFLDDRDAGTSQAGERVWLRILSDETTSSDTDENTVVRTCEFEIVGCDTGKVHETETVKVHTDVSGKPPKFDLVDLQMALTVLAWSGVHATKEDQRNYLELLGRKIPDELKEESEVNAQ